MCRRAAARSGGRRRGGGDGDPVGSERPETRVVMLTGDTSDAVLAATVRAGCCGYLRKDRPLAEVVSAVRAAYAGEVLMPPEMLARALRTIRRPRGGVASELTSREVEILEQVQPASPTRRSPSASCCRSTRFGTTSRPSFASSRPTRSSRLWPGRSATGSSGIRGRELIGATSRRKGAGTSQQEALSSPDPELPQGLELGLLLDSLGEHGHAHLGGERSTPAPAPAGSG